MDDFSRRGARVVIAAVLLEQADAHLDAVDVVVQRAVTGADAVLGRVCVVLDGPGLEEVILERRQLEAVVLDDLVVAVLDRLAVLAKVIVERLAVLGDLLEARVLLDHAAVDPVGVRTGRVETVQVLLEHAVGAEYAARRILLALRRDREDSGGHVAVILEVVGRAVDDLPGAVVGGLPVLVVRLAVLVGQPAVGEGPLRVKGQIGGGHDRGLVGVARAGAICRGVPARELVALTIERACRKLTGNSRREALGVHRAGAAVRIERHRVRVEGVLVELGDKGHIRGDLGVLVNARAPAGERVGEVLIALLGRRLARVHRRSAVLHLVGLVDGALEALPGHRVGVHLLGERRRVGRVAGDGGYLRRPALELIAVLSIAGLGRRAAAVDGDRSIGDLLVLEGGVAVLPGDRVGVDGLVVRGCVRDVARNLVNRRSPTLEGVGVLGISRLRRRHARVGRSRSIGDAFIGLEQRPVLVHPLHIVGVDALRIGCGVRRVTDHGNDVGLAAVLGDRLPSSKRIRVLGVPRLGGRVALVGRNGAVLHLVRLEHRTVGVLPRNGVLVCSLRVGGLVGHVRNGGRDLGRPAVEGVAVLGVAFLRGGRTSVLRGFARLHGIGGKDRPVIVDPGDLVGFLADLPRSVRIIELGARLGTGGFGIGRIRIL